MNTFLDREELCALTGRKLKSKQIVALRRMNIPFYVNALGKPVVTRSAIEGCINGGTTGGTTRATTTPPNKPGWRPNVLAGR